MLLNMKILIIGASSMLGKEIHKEFSEHQVIPIDHDKLDISNFMEVQQAVEILKPGLLINCEEFSGIDNCQINVETAYQINGFGAKNIAIASDKYGVPLVHISTDMVFDGVKGAYEEYDQTNPINIYGKSKLVGEINVTSLTNRFFVIRSQWLFGYEDDFLWNMLNNENALKVANDQFGCPTYAVDLARMIKAVVLTGQYGLYHLTNYGCTSLYDLIKEFFELIGKNSELSPVKSEDLLEICSAKLFPKNNYLSSIIPAEVRGARHYIECLQDYISRIKLLGNGKYGRDD